MFSVTHTHLRLERWFPFFLSPFPFSRPVKFSTLVTSVTLGEVLVGLGECVTLLRNENSTTFKKSDWECVRGSNERHTHTPHLIVSPQESRVHRWNLLCLLKRMGRNFVGCGVCG